MGRRPLPDRERREPVTIRLPKWMLEKLKKKGKISRIIEEMVKKSLKDEEID
jgi:hypothetical protein